jgi:hypothetical protein
MKSKSKSTKREAGSQQRTTNRDWEATHDRKTPPDKGWWDGVCKRLQSGITITASGGWEGAIVDSVETDGNFACIYGETPNDRTERQPPGTTDACNQNALKQMSKKTKSGAAVRSSEFVRPATVAQLIAKLKTMQQDLPVYVRPKYKGFLAWCDDAAVILNGVNEMHPEGEPKNVTLLV